MGMDADVIAIGKFKSILAEYLDYPKEYYDDTKEGADIIVSLFLCNTTDQSHQLAEALCINPWDFNEHKINLDFVREDLLEQLELENDIVHEVKSFQVLRQAGFIFYFRPNG